MNEMQKELDTSNHQEDDDLNNELTNMDMLNQSLYQTQNSVQN